MTTPINPLPTPPSPADSPADFNAKAFALLGALPAFVTEANAQASGLDAAVAAAELEADAAALKASEALTSANNAALSKTGADSARDAAVIAKNAAEAALDSFDDRYLGAKAVAPTTDNDGGALLTGALYWDTSLPGMRSWNGGAWVTLPAATAAAISNTPAGSIAATTVQGAINELDAGKFGRNTILGAVSQSAGVPTGALIEQGSNSNGRYLRFADGTQICTWKTPSAALPAVSIPVGQIYKSTDIDILWTFPAAFSSEPAFSGSVVAGIGNAWVGVPEFGINSATSCQFRLYAATPQPGGAIVQMIAIGRWF